MNGSKSVNSLTLNKIELSDINLTGCSQEDKTENYYLHFCI